MDARWLKFRSEYTPEELAMDIDDSVNRGNRQVGRIPSDQTEALDRVGRSISDGTWATESALYGVQDEISGLRDDVRNGFMGMAQFFSWGISRLCWEHEQDRQVYRELLDVMRHPQRTQAEEHWENARKDMANKRWPEAIDELKETIQDDRRHYLAHFHLGHIIFFRQELSDPAIEQFELAARYADEIDASESQRYWAALAYAHMALLYRLYGETSDFGQQEWLEKARSAATRAMELVPTLPPALHEAVLTNILLGDEAAARKIMEKAVRQDERLLLGLERNPQLMVQQPVGEFVQRWRGRSSGLADAINGLLARLNALTPQFPSLSPISTVFSCDDPQPYARLSRGIQEARRLATALTEANTKRLGDATATSNTRQAALWGAQREFNNASENLGTVRAERLPSNLGVHISDGFVSGLIGLVVALLLVALGTHGVNRVKWTPDVVGHLTVTSPFTVFIPPPPNAPNGDYWMLWGEIIAQGRADHKPGVDGWYWFWSDYRDNADVVSDIADSVQRPVSGREYRSLHWEIPDAGRQAFIDEMCNTPFPPRFGGSMGTALLKSGARLVVSWRTGFMPAAEKSHLLLIVALAAFFAVWAAATLVFLTRHRAEWLQGHAKRVADAEGRLRKVNAYPETSQAAANQASDHLDQVTRDSAAIRQRLGVISEEIETAAVELRRLYHPGDRIISVDL